MQGCAGGSNVVDEEYSLSRQFFGMGYREASGDVLSTVAGTVQAALGARIPDARQDIGEEGKMELLGQPLGYELGLIEPALAASLPRKRNRDDTATGCIQTYIREVFNEYIREVSRCWLDEAKLQPTDQCGSKRCMIWCRNPQCIR